MSFKVYLPSEAEKLIFKSPDVEITLDSGRSITELLLVFHKATARQPLCCSIRQFRNCNSTEMKAK